MGFVTHIALAAHLLLDHRGLIEQFTPTRCHEERLQDEELLKAAIWARFRAPTQQGRRSGSCWRELEGLAE